ncbi:hypothetical protein PMIN02_007487 [Paraphaeosphaeria minitans]
MPQAYADAEYTYLKGTGYNNTHWTLNVRCRGCSQWQDTEGKTVSLDSSNAASPFAHGLTNKAPIQPAKNTSVFNVHSSFGHWTLDLSQGKNADFEKLVAANLMPNVPPATTSTSALSSHTSSRTSTLSTSAASSSTPGPIQTEVPSSCAGVSTFHSPVLTAHGWKAVKVAGNLVQPRGLVFDTAGRLLVIQNGLGITAHTIGNDGCFTSERTVIAQRNLNHGIVLSQDGKTLYASSATQVYSWDYDAATNSVGNSSRIIISGMDSKGHVTRTLVIPPKHPNLLTVSHGSNDNFDYDAGNIKVGRSCIKAFDVTKIPTDGYNYASGGHQLGYGLRNGVGLAFDADGSGKSKMHRMRSTEQSTVQVSTFMPTTQLTRSTTLAIHPKRTPNGTGTLLATQSGLLISSWTTNSRSATSLYSLLTPHSRMQHAIPEVYPQNLPYRRILRLWTPSSTRTIQACM